MFTTPCPRKEVLMNELIQYLKEFEVVEFQKKGLYRLIDVNSRNLYVLTIVKGALFWAYLIQKEKRPTIETFLEIGERELRDFSSPARLEVILFLQTFWKRTRFFDAFLNKYTERFVGQDAKIRQRGRIPRTRRKHY